MVEKQGENNTTVLKIALAGFLHDIGKFAERAGWSLSEEYIQNNSLLYQPLFRGRYTHRHAVYTAGFIELNKEILPSEFNNPQWGAGDSFINLASSHHKPETPMQWIVAIADRISSGLDRDTFERYNQSQDVKDYKKTRMISILEEINISNSTRSDLKYRYPLKPFTPEGIFPVQKEDAEPEDNSIAEKEYGRLFDSFLDDLRNLYHRNYIDLWLENFDTLYQHYTSFIPSTTVGDVVPDVSLYDHSKTTSALATALYLYHHEIGDLEDIDSIKDYTPKKFLFLTGDFYGIQDFIFSKGGSTQKSAAKILRGRSFYISLLGELAADLICRVIGLTPLSVVLSAAGKFTIIAPNTKRVLEEINSSKKEIDNWFFRYFFGESSIGIGMVEVSPDDLTGNRFPSFWRKLTSSVNEMKYKRLDLKTYTGVVDDYLNRFRNDLNQPLCPFCGKRPSEIDYEAESICLICYDHITIGKNIVKESPNIAITKEPGVLHRESIKSPIFNRYHLYMSVSGELNSVAKEGNLLRYWALSTDNSVRLARKDINNYIPRYPAMDQIDDKYIDMLLCGEKTERKKDELFDAIREGSAKSFYHIAKESLVEKDDRYFGIEALGIFKADIDNLGLIFATGLEDADGNNRITISRLATMSRMINSFFTVYLPFRLKTDHLYSNTYTLFAGGDDLFLIGPWNRMIDFAKEFYEDFRRYFCHNPDFTISAGMMIVKPDYPVQAFASAVDRSLDRAKDDKDSLNVFDVNIPWRDLNNLLAVKDQLHKLIESETISHALLYKINSITEMTKKEELIRKGYERGEAISTGDIEALKWRALLGYYLARNAGREIKDKDQRNELIKTLIEKFVLWLETYRDQIRLPLWSLLYETRRLGG